MKALVAGLALLAFAACASPDAPDGCGPLVVDTVVASTGDTLVVSTQFCLTPPPFDGHWEAR